MGLPAVGTPCRGLGLGKLREGFIPDFPDIPEGGVVQRPDGSRYIKGPLNVIFGYDSCPEDTDLSQPGNTPFTGDCVFCGYHCPILAAEQDPDAFCGD